MCRLIYISIHQKPKTQKILKQNIDYYLHNIMYVFRNFNLSKWMGRSSQIWPTFFLICQTSHVPSGFSVYSNSQLDSIVLTILLNQRDNSSTILLLFRKPKRYFIRKVMTNCSALSLICITLKPTYYRLSYEWIFLLCSKLLLLSWW